PGQDHDAPAGRELLRRLPSPEAPVALIMDRAYEGDATRQPALDLELSACRSAAREPGSTVELRPSSLPATERDRAPVSAVEEVPANLLPLRQAGRNVHRLHSLRADRRGPTASDLSVNRP